MITDRERAQHALYPIHYVVNISYEELNREAQRTVDKVAALIGEIKKPIRELHKPFGVYDNCGHDHNDAELADEICLRVDDVGLTCDEGLMYEICRECCTNGDYQTEECGTNHRHVKGKPICPTIAALDGAA